MVAQGGDCLLCEPTQADASIGRVEVWADARWRLTTAVAPGPIAGFSYLEPRRHVPSIADLDGEEARTFGEVLARCCAALTEAAEAERTYVYVFGGSVPHLHVHLAPHREGDALADTFFRGEIEERPRDDGLVDIVSRDFADLDPAELERVAEAARQRLAGFAAREEQPLVILPRPEAPSHPDPAWPTRPPQRPDPAEPPWRPFEPWASDQ